MTRTLVARVMAASHGRETAIDEEERARHERGVGGRKEEDAGGDFIGRARPPEDGGLGGVLPVLLEGSPQRGGAPFVKGREDGPRTDGVHPDTVSRVVHRHSAREPGHRGLRRVVLRRLAHARHRPDRRDVDDAAAAALSHEGDRRLRTERVALEVHAQDLVPALGAGLDHRVIEPDPGIVDEDVKPAEAVRRLPDESRGLGLALHVRFDKDGLAAAGLDLRGDTLAPIAVAIGERHLCSLLHEASHRGLADARRSAGHGRNLPDQSLHEVASVGRSQCVARSAIASARARTRRASSTCRFSIRRPSSTATPRPPARASAWAVITRRAQSTSPAAGAKTSLPTATCLGWISVLPSKPKSAAWRQAAAKPASSSRSRWTPSSAVIPAARAASTQSWRLVSSGRRSRVARAWRSFVRSEAPMTSAVTRRLAAAIDGAFRIPRGVS